MSKKALCIGINDYPGTGSDLSGCVNDAQDWELALKSRGFLVDKLLDRKATKENIISHTQKLVQDANRGDTVVITFSGHGSWVPDIDGDEPDGRDEVLCPYDITQNRPITDDELYTIFSKRKYGVKIVFVSDSCHSGSVSRKFTDTDSTPRFLHPDTFLTPELFEEAVRRENKRVVSSPRPFGGILLSGCQDTEYSYDATFNNRPSGAFTYFALQTLNKLPANATYTAWHKSILKYLPSSNYPQKPKLSGTSTQKLWRVLS